MSKRNSLYILFILASLLAFTSGKLHISFIFSHILADFEDLITNVYSVSTVSDSTASKYRNVGMAGGAYLYIKGSGFSSRSPDSNIVMIGTDLTCPVIGKSNLSYYF